MAYASETAFVPAESRGFFADIAARYSAWRQYRKTYAELSRLTDRELNDIGVHRSQIAAIARGER